MDVLLFSLSAAATLWHLRKSGIPKKEAPSSLQKALEDGTSLNAGEQIYLVSPTNEVLGPGTRATMRLQNLWHRATYCLIKHEPAHLTQHGQDLEDIYVLVQKRSLLKDYCPGKLDPVPGGVVGFGETYHENIVREMEEEMGIKIGDDSTNRIVRLFTFPHEDERVRVWGDFYECTYTGNMHELVLQEEEVDSILRMSLKEVKDIIEQQPDAFMPDACHAMRLYLQRRHDVSVNRRLLHGYSSSNLNAYNLRPRPEVFFFDCDDCLYFDNWKTAKKLTAKINEWCMREHGLPDGAAYKLYKEYGTALRGLIAEGYIENTPAAIDAFLQDVHDIGVPDLIKPDPALREMLLRLDPSIPRYIFTASVEDHARRCLKALGIEDLFEDTIIDCKKCDLETKHSKHAFKKAMEFAGVTEPEKCLFVDDSIANLRTANQVGWRSVLVGRVGRDHGKPVSSEHSELEVDRIHDLEIVLPELFIDNKETVTANGKP